MRGIQEESKVEKRGRRGRKKSAETKEKEGLG